MEIHSSRFASAILLVAGLTACAPQRQDPQELKERTAQATADLKRDTKAVAAGIREGWSRDNPLDLNSATKDQLMSLPGLSAAAADRVIAGRPYSAPGNVLSRHILTKAEYDRISDRVTAK